MRSRQLLCLLWLLAIATCTFLILTHQIITSSGEIGSFATPPSKAWAAEMDVEVDKFASVEDTWSIWRTSIDDFPCHDPGIKLPYRSDTADGLPLNEKAFYTKNAFNSHEKIPTRGLLFLKPMKVGSSTATGINLRISKNVAERQHANFSLCENSYDHAVGQYFRNRDVVNSFLWSFVRQPDKRAVSWFYHFVISRRKVEPTLGLFKASLANTKDYYLKLHRLEAKQWEKKKKTEQFYNMTINGILQSYNFIGITERFDESLMVLQQLLGVPLGDLLYFSVKVNGEYDDKCHLIRNTHLTPQMKAYLKSQDWLDRMKWDKAFYDAANAKLERTIDKLGRAKLEKNLETFQAAKKVVADKCQPLAKLPCDDEGARRNANETNCLFLDSACAYDCIDQVAKELGLDDITVQ